METIPTEDKIFCIILKDKEIFYPLLCEDTANKIRKDITGPNPPRFITLKTKDGDRMLSVDQIASIIPYNK